MPMIHFALGSGSGGAHVGIYNLAHGPDVPALFGLNYLGNIAYIQARVRPGDYGISSGSLSISQGLAITGVDLTLWGVPGRPVPRRATARGRPTSTGRRSTLPDLPKIPFLSAPTSCTDTPAAVHGARRLLGEPRGLRHAHVTTDADGTPFIFDGCDRLPFNPSIDVKSLSRVADAPTAL